MEPKNILTVAGIILVSLGGLYFLLDFLIPDSQDYVDDIPAYAKSVKGGEIENLQPNVMPNSGKNVIADIKHDCESDLSNCFALLAEDPGGMAKISVCGLVVADLTSMLDPDNDDHLLWAREGQAYSVQNILDKNPFLVDNTGTAVLLRDYEHDGYPRGMNNINQQYCVEGLLYLASPNDGWIVVDFFEESGGCMSFVEEHGHNFPMPEMLKLVKLHCST